MILLITPSARAQECATAVELETAQPTQVVKNFQEAADCLHCNQYSAVIVDEQLLEVDPDQSEQILQHIETAVPIYVNCALAGSQRVVREVRATLHRRRKEEIAARKAANLLMRSELCEPLTAILLDCELALSLPDLPFPAQEKIRAIDAMARVMAKCLEIEHLTGSVK